MSTAINKIKGAVHKVFGKDHTNQQQGNVEQVSQPRKERQYRNDSQFRERQYRTDRQHLSNKQYLNDIANKNWRNLRPTKTVVSTNPVVGFYPGVYSWNLQHLKFATNSVRYPFLGDVKSFQRRSLRPAQTIDKSLYVANKEYKSRPAMNRKQLLSEVRSFDCSRLNHVRSRRINRAGRGFSSYPRGMQRMFLNDISNGRWRLRHVQTIEKTLPIVNFPTNFTWGFTRKTNTSYIRYPFLSQIRSFQSQRLRRVSNSRDRSMYIPDRSYKMGPVPQRKQLFAEIRSFDQSKLKHVNAGPGFMSQARMMFGKALGSFSGGKSSTGGQRSSSFNRMYLSDLSQRKWKLNHVNTVERTNPVVGVPKGYSFGGSKNRKFRTNFVRYPFLSQIRGFQRQGLRPSQNKMRDSSRFQWSMQNWKFSTIDLRKQLNLSIRDFDRSNLRSLESSYPQARTMHSRRYLNDIARGTWGSLNHVQVKERRGNVGLSQWKMSKPADRARLLRDVREGQKDLNHVETIEKKLAIEPGFQLKKGNERENLMNEIREHQMIGSS